MTTSGINHLPFPLLGAAGKDWAYSTTWPLACSLPPPSKSWGPWTGHMAPLNLSFTIRTMAMRNPDQPRGLARSQ